MFHCSTISVPAFHYQMFHCSNIRCFTVLPLDVILFQPSRFYYFTVRCSTVPSSLFHCSTIRCYTVAPPDVLLFHQQMFHFSTISVSLFHHQRFKMLKCSTIKFSTVPLLQPSDFSLFHHEMFYCSLLDVLLFLFCCCTIRCFIFLPWDVRLFHH